MDGWWNKPTWAYPLTVINSDGTWSTDVTTGGNDEMATKYAAFLVHQSYSPPLLSGAQTLPAELYSNSAAHVQKNKPCPFRKIQFSGFTWQVKYSAGPAGPGPNYFSDNPNDVYVDSAGRLHLKIVNRNGRWYSTEVINSSVLGYGKYVFQLASPVGGLDPSVVLGLFTWDASSAAYYHREIDIEFSTWAHSNPSYKNAQYVTQPYWTAGNMHRFDFCRDLPTPAASTHSFNWRPNSIAFQSSSKCGTALTKWVYSGSDIPPEGKEQARINLWLFNGKAPTDKQPVGIIIKSFKFIPYP